MSLIRLIIEINQQHLIGSNILIDSLIDELFHFYHQREFDKPKFSSKKTNLVDSRQMLHRALVLQLYILRRPQI